MHGFCYQAAAFTLPMLTRRPVWACVFDTEPISRKTTYVVIGGAVAGFDLNANAILAQPEGAPGREDVQESRFRSSQLNVASDERDQ